MAETGTDGHRARTLRRRRHRTETNSVLAALYGKAGREMAAALLKKTLARG